MRPLTCAGRVAGTSRLPVSPSPQAGFLSALGRLALLAEGDDRRGRRRSIAAQMNLYKSANGDIMFLLDSG